ncbi:MAG: DNA polymerase III subunit delta [Chloroflexi bacterium]|nr:DNA polymerase III subunit delta [Chloroflexota bacterium]
MSATPRFYILHGDDSISRQGALAKMRAAMGEDAALNCSEFDGRVAPVPEVLAAAKSLPFLADKRLVIARGLISHITRKGAGQAGKQATKRLIDELANLPEFARLVLVEDELLSEKNAVLKAARESGTGYIGAFKAPQDLTGWIMQRARAEYDAEIGPAAAAAIASVVNEDMLRADSELHKLVCYVDGERQISEGDVAVLTPYVPEANVFEMVDALANGDGERALRLIYQSLHDNPKDPGFNLYGMIVRQFRLLVMAKEHLETGGSSQGPVMGRALKVHPFVAGKLATQSRAFTLEQLERILKHLQRFDQDMKMGRIAPRLALDLLVSGLARQ